MKPITDKTISIIVPVYNEQANIDPLTDRLLRVMTGIGTPFEILFVDDGSSDNSLNILKRRSSQDARIRYISFSRNFGHEVASTAGMDSCVGDAAVLIDADLQDPPEVIPLLINKWKEGYDVVYAKRAVRPGEGLKKRVGAWLFYRILQKLSEVAIPLDTGDFRLMDKCVIHSLRLCREHNRFVRGLVAWVGFEQVGIEYNRDERLAGSTKYSFMKLLLLSLDAIISFSNVPLRLASIFGILAMFFSVCIGIAVIVHKLFLGLNIPGYALATAGLFFLFGIQMFLMGIMGEYMGRMYKQVQNRPLYLIKDSQGITR